MTTLHGRIEEGVVANVLQYLSLGQATGCLLLRHPDRLHGSIYVREGRIVFVDARPLYDVAALGALLRWTEGRFTFRPGVAAPRVTLDRTTDALLLEAAHRADEAGASDADLEDLDADAVLRVVASPQRTAAGARAPHLAPRPPLQGAHLPAHGANGAAHGTNGAARAPYEAARARSHAHDHGGPSDDTVALSLAALHLWRRLDGATSLREHAARIGRPVTEVVEAGSELVRAGLAEFAATTVADPRFARELAREAVDLLGPVGEIVVEDALFDLGLAADALPVTAVDELIREIERGFPDLRVRREFLSRASELRRLFALETDEPAALDDVRPGADPWRNG